MICHWAINRTDPQNLLSTTLDVPLQFLSYYYVAPQTNMTYFIFPLFLVTSILCSLHSFPYSNQATRVGNGPLKK